MVVLDASVILKWSRPDEPHFALAEQFRVAHARELLTIAVPSLFFYEAASAVGKWGWPADARRQMLTTLLRARFRIFRESAKLLHTTMEVMDRYGLWMRDACYVALGQIKGSAVVTADARVWRKVRRVGLVHYLPDVADLAPYHD